MFESVRDQVYGPLLTAHGAWRWLVLAFAFCAVGTALTALLRRGRGSNGQAVTARLFVTTVDIQLALGLALYLFVSPIVHAGFDSARDGETVYFLVFHLVAMLAVVILAHAGKIAAARADAPIVAARRAALIFSPALLILVAAIPWWRPLLRL